jgi:hypothetical protein
VLLELTIGQRAPRRLDAALTGGAIRITEITEAGHVPEIRVRNDAERPVLIIDGEELVGAKQNRTVNISILVAAHADLHVPVTCVAAGRWRARSNAFAGDTVIWRRAAFAPLERSASYMRTRQPGTDSPRCLLTSTPDGGAGGRCGPGDQDNQASGARGERAPGERVSCGASTDLR